MVAASREGSARPKWLAGLRVPIVAAPMFLVSGPELAIASCLAGVVGSIPAHNARDSAQFEDWVRLMRLRLPDEISPYAVNLITHRSNPRKESDLMVLVANQVPIVITSIGSPGPVLDSIHGYGGLVWSDVGSVRHARKSIDAGADGLILLCAGAGGNTGTLNPFAFLSAVREIYDGLVLVAGGITNGAQVHALTALGCDLAYVGTPFIVAQESLASNAYQSAIVGAEAADVTCTSAVSGVPANVLAASLEGLDLVAASGPDGNLGATHKGWLRQIWGAGHGVGAVRRIEPAASIVARFHAELETARTAWRATPDA